jgi:hypothetical protein
VQVQGGMTDLDISKSCKLKKIEIMMISTLACKNTNLFFVEIEPLLAADRQLTEGNPDGFNKSIHDSNQPWIKH